MPNKSTGALLLDRGQLEAWRQKIQAGDPEAQQVVGSLRKEADHLLELAATSVMDKGVTRPAAASMII